MARSRLALVNVSGDYEGPWAYNDGYARMTVVVRNLHRSEAILLEYTEVTKAGVQRGCLALGEGETDVVIRNWKRYRFCKRSGDGLQCSTTVEVFPERVRAKA